MFVKYHHTRNLKREIFELLNNSQAQKCGEVKPVNGIPTLPPFSIIGYPTAIRLIEFVILI